MNPLAYLKAWQHVRHANASRRKNYPPRVSMFETFWTEPPPEQSARCSHWVDRINAGWRPGKRINLGYYGNAQYLGVYIWEYLHVISPLLHNIPKQNKNPQLKQLVEALLGKDAR